ncbi:MAG: RuvX/YqgF family protein [Candidatus Peregrinibacteria bacterium]|nr:RuvX/YqgF family protein [Candidatus Peregrinibacteria bacterium]
MKKIDPKALKNLEVENTAVRKHLGEKVLALDYGEKFCGLAWSPDGVVVLPVGVFSLNEILGEIIKVLNEKQIDLVIVGLPVSSDGSENEVCGMIRKFVEKLEPVAKVELVNERFSSQRVLSSDKDRIDDLAAARILEYYLAG